MATSQEVYALIKSAVQLIIPELNGNDTSPIEERIAARIWPYITHAVRDLDPSAIENPAPKKDGRAKTWNYVIRFWHVTPIGNDLAAETETEIMQSTGSLLGIISNYGKDMHDGETPAELTEEAIKEKLPQLRNNLGRQGSAVLRIPYDFGSEQFICQVDIIRPNT